MAAMELDWVPQTLYGASVSSVTERFGLWREYVKQLPSGLQFDVYYKLYQQGQLVELAAEFRNLDVFAKVLVVVNKRLSLHHCFQAIRDHGDKISEQLAESYGKRVHDIISLKCSSQFEKMIALGFHLGGFLSDAGWNWDSSNVFETCYNLCLSRDKFDYAFECCIRLLHVFNANCMYSEAEKKFLQAQELFMRLVRINPDREINLASLFAEYGAFYFAKSEYDKAYQWSIEALKMLNKPGKVTLTTTVDVLRMASRACVVKRQFRAAEHLVKHAVQLSKSNFGSHHPKYSSTLLDFGFFLLNIDHVCQSEKVYQAALTIRQWAFGGQNLHVAVAHEDLAYASYVHQYSTGKFNEAKGHADAAINILSNILPKDHLHLASSKRVKALILEEIAIDSTDSLRRGLLLKESHDLHQQSLALSQKAFGERNVQTAKHYGNLGRLYQSMEQYKEAEKMHLKAIKIKEELLGPNDYEVALSVGHLASLYNYDLKEYDKAEELYLRSIAIAKMLFGEGYSGLEYDYRGLIKLYNSKVDFEKVMEYNHILSEWAYLRQEQFAQLQDAFEAPEVSSTVADDDHRTTTSVLEDFFRDSIPLYVQKTEKPIVYDYRPRSSNEIAFNIGLKVKNQDSTVPKNDSQSTQDEISPTETDEDYYRHIDNDVRDSLLLFNVYPQYSDCYSDLCSSMFKSNMQGTDPLHATPVDNVKNTIPQTKKGKNHNKEKCD